MDRLFEIHPSATKVTFKNLVLQEGFSSEEGGAIQNWSPGLVKLEQRQRGRQPRVEGRRRHQQRRPGGLRLDHSAAADAAARAHRDLQLGPRGELVGRRRRGHQQRRRPATIYISHSEIAGQPGRDDRRSRVRPGPARDRSGDPHDPGAGRLRARRARDRQPGPVRHRRHHPHRRLARRRQHRAPRRRRRGQPGSRQPDHRALALLEEHDRGRRRRHLLRRRHAHDQRLEHRRELGALRRRHLQRRRLERDRPARPGHHHQHDDLQQRGG